MRTEYVEQPLPEALQPHARALRRELADLQAEFQRRAAPILRALAEAERFRPPPQIILITETDEERAQMAARLGIKDA